MTVKVDGDVIYVFGAFHDNTFDEYSLKYVKKAVHDLLKKNQIYGVQLWNRDHPDKGTFMFEVLDPFREFYLPHGELK